MPSKDTPSPMVPKTYAGKWIAWNPDQTEILGSGRTLREAREAVTKNEKDAIFAKAPHENVRFVGSV